MRAPRRWLVVIVLASLVLVQAGCAALPGSTSMRQDEPPAGAVESSVQPTAVVAVSATVEPARATLTRMDVDAYPAPARFDEAAPAPVASPTAVVPERPVPAAPAALDSDD